MKYGGLVELMAYLEPCYNYGDWLMMVQYMPSMWRHAVIANYIQLQYNNQNKGADLCIDGRTKELGNLVGLINNTRKKPNYIFQEHEGNKIFVCAVKTIVVGEELLVEYNLN